MSANNPFNLNFGVEPDRNVDRSRIISEIIENFNSASPSSMSYLITGVRGSGKTVLMNTIANRLRESANWIVLPLNPMRPMLNMLAASLYDDAKVSKLFISSELNLSNFGIGMTFKKVPPISDIQVAIRRMASLIKDKGKRILVTVDEVTKSDNLIEFASAYQDLIGQKLPVFLLMTGLYENIESLSKDKRCSFLLGNERIKLDPLSVTGMKNIYAQTFQTDDNEALNMALFTRGYSYAFQVLGYLRWELEQSNAYSGLASIERAFDMKMEAYAYEKIWEDLPPNEKKLVLIISKHDKPDIETRTIMELAGLSNSEYSVYRDRLSKRGLINAKERGVISLALPRFDIFALDHERYY